MNATEVASVRDEGGGEEGRGEERKQTKVGFGSVEEEGGNGKGWQRWEWVGCGS